jgi:hypothetical protein
LSKAKNNQPSVSGKAELTQKQMDELKVQVISKFSTVEEELSTPAFNDILNKTISAMQTKLSTSADKDKPKLAFIIQMLQYKLGEPQKNIYIAPNGNIYTVISLPD